ncbi:2-amino-4-hydroxy-6-hydroxymethyldihydropteridine diphosphokinase [Rhodobacter flavimaris]|nr:2-amino-4-hydroxy-6-hydroxymethyldihydropteridine diphosphokinase [Sinirhodobacter sp. WL0062]
MLGHSNSSGARISTFMYSNTFLVAVGSNLPSQTGSSAETVRSALTNLPAEGLHLAAVSRFHRSPAFPAGSGPDFVNACAVVRGEMGAVEALAALHRVEEALGRSRTHRWEARKIDLDLLAMGDAVLPDLATFTRWTSLPLEAQMREVPDQLILPHPRMADRAFVLIPLAEIAPRWRHPVSGKTVAEMAAALPEAEKAALQAFDPATSVDETLVNTF